MHVGPFSRHVVAESDWQIASMDRGQQPERLMRAVEPAKVEAAAAAMGWAFQELGWPEVIHLIDPANAASLAVAGKLGSTRRGPADMPEPFHERRTDLHAQTAAQWWARRRSLGTSKHSD